MLTHEAIVFYVIIHTALIACLIVLAGMGLKKLKEGLEWRFRANRPVRSCSKTTSAR